MSKIKIDNSTFIKSQIGDFNLIVNDISSDIKDLEEIKPLFVKLYDAIEKSPFLEKYEKEDALNSLQEVVTKLSEPVDKQDKKGITSYWKKMIETVKDINQILPIVQSLGELLKLQVL